MSQLITFSEAAALTGVSVKSIYRHVAKGKLLAVQTLQGKRIDKDTLERHLSQTEKVVPTKENGLSQTEKTVRGWENAGEKTVPGDENCLVPLVAHLAALDLARAQLAQVELYRERAEVARTQALAAERGRMALELQLGQYQRALAEQADSLAEERARRQHLESACSAAVTETPLNLEDLKTDMQTTKRGFRYRLGRWLLGEKTG